MDKTSFKEEKEEEKPEEEDCAICLQPTSSKTTACGHALCRMCLETMDAKKWQECVPFADIVILMD